MLQGNLVAITAQQVLVMFLLILAGYLAVRARVLDAGARQGFSSLLVNLVVPAMIVDSYLIPFDPDILANLVRTALVSTSALLIGLGYWNDWKNGLYYITDTRLYSIQNMLNQMLKDIQFLKSGADASAAADLAQDMPSVGIKMAIAVVGALPIMIVLSPSKETAPVSGKVSSCLKA